MRNRPAALSARLAIGVLSAVLVAACGSATQSATPKTYTGTLTFASFNPFTGPDASFGPEMDAGCIVASHLINKSGGVLGHQTTCITVDTRGDPADAEPAAQKMLATT